MNNTRSLLLLGLIGFAVSIPQKTKGNPAQSPKPKRQVSVNIIENEFEGETPNYAKLGDPRVCGLSSRQLSEVSRHAKSAHARDWPWMALIFNTRLNGGFCGGSILTRKHILTAAHCKDFDLYDKDAIVRVGEYDYGKANETQIQDFKIKSTITHEDYDKATYENDIAIIILDGQIKYTFFALPVCLPLPTDHFEGKIAVVAGWGVIVYEGTPSKTLKELAVPVWQRDECVNSYSQTVFSTMLCASNLDGGEDACQGDSGGPLFTQRADGKWIQIGIVSWGVKCAVKGKPGVYTEVAKYVDWIAPRIQDA